MLLEAGADVQAVNDGWSAYDAAVQKGYNEVAETLTKAENP